MVIVVLLHTETSRWVRNTPRVILRTKWSQVPFVLNVIYYNSCWREKWKQNMQLRTVCWRKSEGFRGWQAVGGREREAFGGEEGWRLNYCPTAFLHWARERERALVKTDLQTSLSERRLTPQQGPWRGHAATSPLKRDTWRWRRTRRRDCLDIMTREPIRQRSQKEGRVQGSESWSLRGGAGTGNSEEETGLILVPTGHTGTQTGDELDAGCMCGAVCMRDVIYSKTRQFVGNKG